MNEKNSDPTVWLSPLVLDKGFNVQFRGDHVHVALGKDFKVQPEQMNEFWDEIGKLCDRHNTRRIFVEGFVPEGELDTTDVIDAGQRTATVPHSWLAYHLKDFVPSAQSELYEVIAASRGVRVKFFSDTEHALMWLRRNAPA